MDLIVSVFLDCVWGVTFSIMVVLRTKERVYRGAQAHVCVCRSSTQLDMDNVRMPCLQPCMTN